MCMDQEPFFATSAQEDNKHANVPSCDSVGATDSMKHQAILKVLVSATVAGLLFEQQTDDEHLSKQFSSECSIIPIEKQKQSMGGRADFLDGSSESSVVPSTSKRRQAVQACRQLKASIKVESTLTVAPMIKTNCEFCQGT